MVGKRFINVSISVIALIGVLLVPSLSKADEDVKKAVYHCDFGDAKRADAMLRNIYNLVNYYTTNGISYDVRVVSNSACVQFMLKDRKGTKFEKTEISAKLAKSINERMQSLVDGYGLKIEQCNITLQRTKIDRSKLKSFVGTTESGQVRVVDLEEKGYAYIKVM